MRTAIRISDAALDLLRANVRPGHTLKHEGVKNPDGTWDVPIGLDTFERLQDLMLEGETVSDALVRLFLTKEGVN